MGADAAGPAEQRRPVTWAPWVFGGAAAGGATVAVLGALRAPLLALLTELCVFEHRARFWWRVAATELVVGTASCASAAVALGGWPAVALVRGACAGLLLSVVTITAGTQVIGGGRRV
jgi:hypothetical protein